MTGSSDINMQLPLVSIVITSYNRAHFIEKAIHSALAQDYSNLEVIISDNCSTDNTDEIIKKCLPDPRIRYFTNETNIGMIANFIKCTNELAKGKYISFVSSDDYLGNDGFISAAVKKIQEYPNVTVVTGINVSEIVHSNDFFTDESYPFYKDSFYKVPFVPGKEVFLRFPACHSISYGGTLIDREKLVSLDTKKPVPISLDIQNILQLLLTGDAAFIDKVTYVARRHEGNYTSSVPQAQTCIDNLAYIDTSYELAMRNALLDKTMLEKWKTAMYVNFCASSLRNYYRQDKTQYNLFAKHVKEKYPQVYKTVTANLDWATHYLVYANKYIGKAYVNSRAFLGKIKRGLKGKDAQPANFTSDK